MKLHDQKSIYESPWSFREKVKLLLWEYAWQLFCSWTPKPFNGWRLFWLRLFGAKLYGKPFVHQRARIQIPWNLTMHDRACLGDRANAYSLGPIELGPASTVAQEVYLSTGTHDFKETMFLMTAKITVGARAFLGARCFVLPGVTIGEDAVIGACSVVTKDMPAGMICAGNPCRILKPLHDASPEKNPPLKPPSGPLLGTSPAHRQLPDQIDLNICAAAYSQWRR